MNSLKMLRLSSLADRDMVLRNSMPHFRGASIGALSHERNSEYLFTVVTGDLHRIVIWILYFLLFYPKEHPTFRTFSNEHGHGTVSIMFWQCREGES